MSKRVKITIWDLWWNPAPLVIRRLIPKKYRKTKRSQKAYTQGMADGVADTLNAINMESHQAVSNG